MGNELSPTVTPVSTEEAWAALGRAYEASRGVAPSRETLACLVAQWALETGWGKQMRCFNIGNVKATPAWQGDFAFFATSERLTPEGAASAVARAGLQPDGSPDARIDEKAEADSRGRVLVRFYPKNAATKFRAFLSLYDGAAAQVRTLTTSFASTLPALESGDPDAWAHALSRARYYTADPAVYAHTLTEVHGTLMGRNYPMPSGTGGAEPPPAPPAPPSSSGGGILAALLGLAFVASGGKL